tara:strand:- start:1419 stop:1619 length:201 start_codon:yes stop_codon:yes gene_type:complete
MGVPARVAQPSVLLRVAVVVTHHPVRVVAFGELGGVALWSVELLSVQDGVVGHGLVRPSCPGFSPS